MRFLRASIAVALAVGAVAGGLTLSAAPASADVSAAPIQYVTDFFWSGGSSLATTGTVSCPSGSRVVSSGASTGGDQGAHGQSLVSIAPDINTFTSATAVSRNAPEYMVVTVGCMSTAAMSEVTTRTIDLPIGSGFRRGTVYCPAGMRAFGGGGYMVRPFGIPSQGSYGMTSNTVTADGTGWTYAAHSGETNTHPVITTQCAPLRGSFVADSRGGTRPIPNGTAIRVDGTATCAAGYTTLSGGVYLSKPDGNEVESGLVDQSVPATNDRWYVAGRSFQSTGGDKLVALEQCIRRNP